MFLLIYGVFIFSMRDKEDCIDEELGWRIQVERDGRGVTYTYTNQKTGGVITGRALKEAYQSPHEDILRHEKEQQEIEKLRAAGVLLPQIARRIMKMVHKSHQDSYESLYLDSVMASSGGYWRYEIGAMEQGLWPNRSCDFNKVEFCIKDSIGGGFNQKIPWGTVTDSVDMLTLNLLPYIPSW